MNIKQLIFLTILTTLFFQARSQNSDWILEKDKEGIKVFTRSIPQLKNKEFKAITVSDKSMQYFEDLIWDAANYKQWQEKVASSKVLESVSDNEMYIYYTTDLPWPLTDRDVIHHVKKESLINGGVRFEFNCLPDYIEEKEDYLRLQHSNGEWIFTPTGEEKVKIEYHFVGDPGGSIPSWVVNLFLVHGPYDTLKKLR